LVRTPGVSQKIAMSISGHKTPSVFERYNIVDESDKLSALAARDAYHAGLPEEKVISLPLTRQPA
jgi:hypothetical protein